MGGRLTLNSYCASSKEFVRIIILFICCQQPTSMKTYEDD